MSLDVCFWKSGSGSESDLYEAAADGDNSAFVPSPEVLSFREQLLARWPEFESCVEPSDYDPVLGEDKDVSRYVLITLPLRQSEKHPAIVDLALSHGLVGYDPQTAAAIS
jgi:hypothetical protein